jgi:hypothetical protein
MTADPNEAGVRYLWIPVQTANRPQMRDFLKSRNAQLAAVYAVTPKAIIQKRLSDGSANVLLMKLPDVPAAPPVESPPLPPMTGAAWLGVLSVAGTFAAAAYGIAKS